MSKGKIERILNVKFSRERHRNWKAPVSKGIAAMLPIKWDLRESWWNVGDQGDTGSCVGQAAVDGALRFHLVKAGVIGKSDKMSVRFVWTAARETDVINSYPSTFLESEGTTLKAALDILRKYGCVPESMLPFDRTRGYVGSSSSFYNTAKKYRISGYFQLNPKSPTQIKQWIANNGPVFTWLPVNDEFMGLRSGRKELKDTGGANLGGHSVCLVGYDKDEFILRNSWGESWGDRGFAYLSTAYLLAKFKECYGITL